jgi:hypothetical protein
MAQESVNDAWTAAGPPAWDASTTAATLIAILSATLLTTIALPLLRAILADYRAFLSLGPGGTPATPAGYLRIKFLGLFALRDPLAPLDAKGASTSTGRLSALPTRHGTRPQVRGIAPHRQADQRAPAGVFAQLAAALDGMAARRPARLVLGTSCLEGHGPGLFARAAAAADADDSDSCSRPQPVSVLGPLAALATRSGGGARQGARATPRCPAEVVHAHPIDGSMHLTLHPADAAAVIGAGWGERHPLGKGGWLGWFVPAGFILVYAPRDEAEVRVAMRIVEAAIWWVGGFDVDGEDAAVTA